MGNDSMWIWWVATVVICAWKIAEGFWRPHRMLEWPFLACAMWAYFYVYMAYDARIALSDYLGNGIANLGQLMPLLCLVGILVGWGLGARVKGRRPPEKRAVCTVVWSGPAPCASRSISGCARRSSPASWPPARRSSKRTSPPRSA